MASDVPARIVDVDCLSFAIGGRKILSQLSFSQERSEHLLLLGPSGVGKTSLINLVTGLASPDSGTIHIAGEAMSASSGAKRDDLRRRKIGVIFQTLRLVSALSVRANLRLAQKLAGVAIDDTAIESLLGAVGIMHRADAKPRALSQGEAQRAAIARALVAKPTLLIADEPTSALDDANAERIGQLLIETAAANGSTLLVATHDKRLKAFIPGVISLAPAEVTA
jgi:putative ABC transport system ATP-binding protein